MGGEGRGGFVQFDARSHPPSPLTPCRSLTSGACPLPLDRSQTAFAPSNLKCLPLSPEVLAPQLGDEVCQAVAGDTVGDDGRAGVLAQRNGGHECDETVAARREEEEEGRWGGVGGWEVVEPGHSRSVMADMSAMKRLLRGERVM